jgi:4-amino-4-deoxy-L-arabinose transferase-like glycosyltransferase
VPLGILAPIAVASALRSRTASTARRELHAATAARVLAIFWCVTVIFFSVAAYKRRTYLLPIVPASAVLVAWWLSSGPRQRPRHVLRGAVIVTCGALIALNPLYQRATEGADCRGASYGQAAAAIDRAVPATEALYSYGLPLRAISPLLFYLGRTAPALPDALENAPTGYVLVDADAWTAERNTLDLHAVLSLEAGTDRFTLLQSRRRR